jgi:hypothetical protein
MCNDLQAVVDPAPVRVKSPRKKNSLHVVPELSGVHPKSQRLEDSMYVGRESNWVLAAYRSGAVSSRVDRPVR